MAQCVPPTNSAQECESRTPEISTQQFTTTKLSVDEILNKYVGEYGVWQWSIVLLIVLSSPLMVTLPVFVNAVPEHRCRMEDPIEEIFKEYNLSFEEAAAFVGPWEGEIPVTMMGCLRFALDWSNATLIENLLLNKSIVSFIDRESLKTKDGEDLSDVDKCLESATDDHIHQNGSNKSIDAGREEFVINLETLEDRIKSSPTTVTNL
ncbi:unnamed protein product [Schistosoma margrebowiei]|uniref:Uncharacterized protein n=1 Tax=Schistosoma margrebowiei TaxID=48269 RepID=A0A183MH52_9TREM|nr:unnamed protein product [Schistosoma margrebowiei]